MYFYLFRNPQINLTLEEIQANIPQINNREAYPNLFDSIDSTSKMKLSYYTPNKSKSMFKFYHLLI